MHLYSFKLEPGATELTQLTEYHRDIIDSLGPEPVHFIGPYEGEQQPITQEKFDELFQKYTNPPNPMQFNFIPIEQ